MPKQAARNVMKKVVKGVIKGIKGERKKIPKSTAWSSIKGMEKRVPMSKFARDEAKAKRRKK